MFTIALITDHSQSFIFPLLCIQKSLYQIFDRYFGIQFPILSLTLNLTFKYCIYLLNQCIYKIWPRSYCWGFFNWECYESNFPLCLGPFEIVARQFCSELMFFIMNIQTGILGGRLEYEFGEVYVICFIIRFFLLRYAFPNHIVCMWHRAF